MLCASRGPPPLRNPQAETHTVARTTLDKKGNSVAAAVAAQTPQRKTLHRLRCGDARELEWIDDESVHLVVTSPPYWTLKEYNEHPDQMGSIEDYESFMDELDKVWEHCYRALVPGGRVVCVVGDVCISRRKNNGRHMVVPLHADISVRCRRIGLDYLTPIFWYKIANANYEVSGGGGFLGKPFEPNAIIKNDVEYMLMLRKPGGYRRPTEQQRKESKLTKEQHSKWFRSFWADVPGNSTRNHPAPYPIELAERLVRMFSFVDDTVVDPFAGTASTAIAAMRAGRNSVSVELDPDYFKSAVRRAKKAANELGGLFSETPDVEVID